MTKKGSEGRVESQPKYRRVGGSIVPSNGEDWPPILRDNKCEVAFLDRIVTLLNADEAQQTPHAAGGEEFTVEQLSKHLQLAADWHASQSAEAEAVGYVKLADWHDAQEKRILEAKAALAAQTSPAAGDGRRIVEFDLKAAQRLLDFFGGDDTLVSVDYAKDGRLMAWASEYPEEGSIPLSDEAEHPQPATEGEPKVKAECSCYGECDCDPRPHRAMRGYDF